MFRVTSFFRLTHEYPPPQNIKPLLMKYFAFLLLLLAASLGLGAETGVTTTNGAQAWATNTLRSW